MADPSNSFASDPESPPPEPLEELVQDRAKRKQKVLLAVVLIPAVLGAGAYALLRRQDAQNRRAVASAWGSFSRCLLGGELQPNERPSLRLRAVQLTAAGMTDAERTAEGSDKPWPASCAPLGHALRESLRTASMEEKGKKDLAHWSEHLGKLLAEPNAFMNDLTEPVEAAWDQAKEAGIEPIAGVSGPKAPAPASALHASFFSSVAPLSPVSFSLKAIYTDAHPGGTLRVLIDERSAPKAPFLCTFDASAASATCASLPAAVAKGHGLRLLGTADDGASPLVFAGNRGGEGVFRADTGEVIDALYSYGGYSTKDGAAAVLGWDEGKKELVLVRKPKEKGRDRSSIKPSFRVGNYYYSSQILWDQLILRGVNKNEERRLYAQSLKWEGDQPDNFTDVGELEEPGLVTGGADEPPHIAGCKTAQITVVRVKGYSNDFMSFLTGGAWSQPVSPQMTGGTLSCHGSEAVITRLEPAAAERSHKTSVTQSRCSTAGCRAEVVQMEPLLKGRFELAPREGHVDAVALNEKLLIVWAAGDRGGVRMRLAPADQIGKAGDVILFDDLVKDGQLQKLSSLLDLRLFSRPGFAVLLLSTVAGVHALRIDDGGKVTPVAITWGT